MVNPRLRSQTESGCQIREFRSKWKASKVWKQEEGMGKVVKAAYYFKGKNIMFQEFYCLYNDDVYHVNHVLLCLAYCSSSLPIPPSKRKDPEFVHIFQIPKA